MASKKRQIIRGEKKEKSDVVEGEEEF